MIKLGNNFITKLMREKYLNCKITYMKTLILILALSVLATQMAYSEEYILCNRDAQITPVGADFDNPEKCYGSVKLQGIMYKCGKESEAAFLPNEFLKKLTAAGKEECESYCKKRAKGCHGYFEGPSKCAFTVPANKSLKFGETMAPCSPECSGRAFIYCSLYHASYLRVEEEYFKDKNPNCYCRSAKK